jgi:aminoglycoside 6'-N-acetyltransferase
MISAGTLRLRDANPSDVQQLLAWDAEPHIIASKGVESWGWERELARSPTWREQLIAEVDDRPIGFIQIIDPLLEDSHYWGECGTGLRAIDIWIGERDFLGKSFGSRMMRRALERCFADPSVDGILVDPMANNQRARRFYERLGFRFVEERRFGDDECAVYRLDREDWRRTESGVAILETARLVLRPWRDLDLVPFARLNADQEVARYLGAPLGREASDALAAKIRAGFDAYDFGLWAAERTDTAKRPFIGFIGLSIPNFEAPFTPCIEIGWRLAREHWGLGLATEGAKAALRFAFDELRLEELVSFTSVENAASRRVMEKIGMTRNPAEDFDHPRLTRGHALRPHVLYRMKAQGV